MAARKRLHSADGCERVLPSSAGRYSKDTSRCRALPRAFANAGLLRILAPRRLCWSGVGPTARTLMSSSSSSPPWSRRRSREPGICRGISDLGNTVSLGQSLLRYDLIPVHEYPSQPCAVLCLAARVAGHRSSVRYEKYAHLIQQRVLERNSSSLATNR